MLGLSREQWLSSRPPLTRENEEVIEVWQFCGGWNPALLPMAAAFYGIEDADLLITQLLLLRDTVEAHQTAKRKAEHGQ